MSQFTVSGRFQGRDGWKSFSKSIDAINESVAREHTLAEFGSKHGLKRTQVEIGDVEAAA
ncbi:50S ribosomal protein L18Ae [Halomarina oriensis]|uniref:Large ribosomal subunit protein eL20 n=1 Tax=Halomarina oriensis TaxID=671145 RepID=A0A6B0GIC0_9EURY|nr:50S ribosomal protein L18Ae [Halomarina oriensis]MWG34370.1 50S ribosomal protein L18a [Halomarina oriensis]